MNDDELRALVRDAVARHLHAHAASGTPRHAAPGSISHPAPGTRHPALLQYLTLVNPDDSCIIEPAVPCNHCGYCKSHGH